MMAVRTLPAQAPVLTLDECVELVPGHNLNLKATQEAEILAQYKIAKARAIRLPKAVHNGVEMAGMQAMPDGGKKNLPAGIGSLPVLLT